MKLDPSETELAGNWVTSNGRIERDATCQRIEWLTEHHLMKVANSKQWGDWETLFQDPDDGRFWERTYPQSELQGGGPRRLHVLSVQQAYAKYELPVEKPHSSY